MLYSLIALGAIANAQPPAADFANRREHFRPATGEKLEDSSEDAVRVEVNAVVKDKDWSENTEVQHPAMVWDAMERKFKPSPFKYKKLEQDNKDLVRVNAKVVVKDNKWAEQKRTRHYRPHGEGAEEPETAPETELMGRKYHHPAGKFEKLEEDNNDLVRVNVKAVVKDKNWREMTKARHYQRPHGGNGEAYGSAELGEGQAYGSGPPALMARKHHHPASKFQKLEEDNKDLVRVNVKAVVKDKSWREMKKARHYQRPHNHRRPKSEEGESAEELKFDSDAEEGESAEELKFDSAEESPELSERRGQKYHHRAGKFEKLEDSTDDLVRVNVRAVVKDKSWREMKKARHYQRPHNHRRPKSEEDESAEELKYDSDADSAEELKFDSDAEESPELGERRGQKYHHRAGKFEKLEDSTDDVVRVNVKAVVKDKSWREMKKARHYQHPHNNRSPKSLEAEEFKGCCDDEAPEAELMNRKYHHPAGKFEKLEDSKDDLVRVHANVVVKNKDWKESVKKSTKPAKKRWDWIHQKWVTVQAAGGEETKHEKESNKEIQVEVDAVVKNNDWSENKKEVRHPSPSHYGAESKEAAPEQDAEEFDRRGHNKAGKFEKLEQDNKDLVRVNAKVLINEKAFREAVHEAEESKPRWHYDHAEKRWKYDAPKRVEKKTVENNRDAIKVEVNAVVKDKKWAEQKKSRKPVPKRHQRPRAELEGVQACASYCSATPPLTQQYDPNCKACAGAGKSPSGNPCQARCGYSPSISWQYDPGCSGCKAAMIETDFDWTE